MLYDNYGAALYGVILRIVQSEHHAENVLQDSFVKIWKNIQSYDASKGRFFTWMLNIARNSAIDLIRSKAFRNSGQTDSLSNQLYNPSKLTTETNIQTMDLENIVNKLNPELKQIIDLAYFKGYTQREIAKEFDIPLGTVKSRVRIAIRELRKLMGENKELIGLLLMGKFIDRSKSK